MFGFEWIPEEGAASQSGQSFILLKGGWLKRLFKRIKCENKLEQRHLDDRLSVSCGKLVI
jgi:hypothetical protein